MWSKICELAHFNRALWVPDLHFNVVNTSCQQTDDTLVFCGTIISSAGWWDGVNQGWNYVWIIYLNISGQFIKETFSSSLSSPQKLNTSITQTLNSIILLKPVLLLYKKLPFCISGIITVQFCFFNILVFLHHGFLEHDVRGGQ